MRRQDGPPSGVPPLARPSQPGKVHAAGEVERLEHPPIFLREQTGPAPPLLPRLRDESPGNDSLLVRGVEFQDEGRRVLNVIGFALDLLSALLALQNAAERTCDGEAITGPKHMNVQETRPFMAVQILENLIAEDFGALSADGRDHVVRVGLAEAEQAERWRPWVPCRRRPPCRSHGSRVYRRIRTSFLAGGQAGAKGTSRRRGP